jgi:hypothetical protein
MSPKLQNINKGKALKKGYAETGTALIYRRYKESECLVWITVKIRNLIQVGLNG